METNETIKTSPEKTEQKKEVTETPKKADIKLPKPDSKQMDATKKAVNETRNIKTAGQPSDNGKVNSKSDSVQTEPVEEVAFPNFEFKSVEEQRRMNVSELRNYADDLKELCLRGY